MKVKLETWTPAAAKKVLAENNNCNRPLSEHWVDILFEAYRRGEWIFDNGDTIKFNQDGELVDGQHRLSMIVWLNKPVKMLTVRDVSNDAFPTLDQGKGRSLGDLLAMRNVASYNTASTVTKFAWLFSKPKPYGDIRKRFSLSLGLSFWEKHRKKISKATALVINKKTGKLGMLGGAYARAMTIAPEQAEAFFPKVMTGLELSELSPAFKLRERLIADKMATERASRTAAMLWIVKTWNAHVHGEVIERLHIFEADYDKTMERPE